MSDERARPGPGAGSTTEKITAAAAQRHQDLAQDTARHRQDVVARAVGLAPSGGRSLWLWIVGRCPLGCGGSHVHRGWPAGGLLRRAGCTTWSRLGGGPGE
jgi:hypothetical protein